MLLATRRPSEASQARTHYRRRGSRAFAAIAFRRAAGAWGTESREGRPGAALLANSTAFLHHPAHATHRAGHASCTGFLGRLGDDRLGHEDALGDRGGVLQRRARDHGRVDDPGLDQVLDLLGVDVEALALGGLADVVDDDRALEAGVVGELAERLLERADDDLRARPLVWVTEALELDRGDRVEERDAASGDDALLECGAGGLEGVLDAVLLLLHLRLD